MIWITRLHDDNDLNKTDFIAKLITTKRKNFRNDIHFLVNLWNEFIFNFHLKLSANIISIVVSIQSVRTIYLYCLPTMHFVWNHLFTKKIIQKKNCQLSCQPHTLIICYSLSTQNKYPNMSKLTHTHTQLLSMWCLNKSNLERCILHTQAIINRQKK